MSKSSAVQPRVLLDGLAYVESARWHDGRFWFAHWGIGEVIAVDIDGKHEIVTPGPERLGWSIDWLPDGRMITTGDEVTRHEPDGSTVQHADLRAIDDHGWNEIVIDGRGNIYVNSIGFDFMAGEDPGPRLVSSRSITPDGDARQVADGIAFPNGMVVTPDNSTLIIAESFASRLTAFDIDADGSLSNRRVWADGVGPDGICMDAEGAIWMPVRRHADPYPTRRRPEGEFIRVLEGGEILERIQTDRAGFACALGGPDRRTLFMLCAEWQGVDAVDDVVARRTGQVLVADASAPGVGFP